MNNLDKVYFPNEYLNIRDYIFNSNLKKRYIEITENNLSKLGMYKKESISLVVIKLSNYNNLIILLDYFSKFIENSAIIIFFNWYDKINQKNNNIRDAVNNWVDDNELIDLIDFPINSWKEKAFIFIRNKIDYMICD